MQSTLFPSTRTVAKAPPVDPEPRRGPGRPARSAEEKARIDAERAAVKAEARIMDPSGGARLGAGRPRKDGELPGATRTNGPISAGAQTVIDYNESRATREKHAAVKEEIVAKKMALEFEIMQGNFLPRDAIITGMARVYSTVTQGIRSIPDLLERRLGLDPMVCVRIGELLDENLATMHVELERLVNPEEQKEAPDGE